jgi:hypothetical protein
MKKLVSLAALLTTLTAVTACSADVDVSREKTVSTDDLEKGVTTTLEGKVDAPLDSVDCPDELDSEKGSEVRCTYVVLGHEIGLTVTSEGVEDDHVATDYQVDDAPLRMVREELEKQSVTKLTQLAGQAPDAVECPDEGLKAEAGATQRCVVSAGEDKIGFTVTVAQVTVPLAFSLQVDDAPMS